MDNISLTNKQARRFILTKQGLAGDHKFIGKKGVLEYIRQAGCIQFDPIDVCGKNPELVLQSRVKDFTKQMLYELLYIDRKLFDYFEKNLAIIETAGWPYYRRHREANRNWGRSFSEVNAVSEEIKTIIREKGAVSSADIGFNNKVHWYWSDAKLSRAALETMYYRGELVIHHKKGAVKYYDLSENCIPGELLDAPEPYPEENEYLKWRVQGRIGAIGLLWNRPSDAWLGIGGLNADSRNGIFGQLYSEGKILKIAVEGIKDKFYCLSSDEDVLKATLMESVPQDRCELLAPLDNMLWDRRLIKTIFDFDYKWEIYTPEVQRKYGYYVIPLLYGDDLAGRAEIVNNRKTGILLVKNIWYEDSVKRTTEMQAAVEECLCRFAGFNDCKDIQYADKQHDIQDQ